MTRRHGSGRFRKVLGDRGEREVLTLLEKSGWIAVNGSPTLNGVDVIAYLAYPRREKGEKPRPRAFAVLHAEAKAEPWGARGRSYLGPVAARWEAAGLLYRIFTKERDGWWVRAIRPDGPQVRTVYKAQATVSSCSLGGLLMGSTEAPATPRAESPALPPLYPRPTEGLSNPAIEEAEDE